MNIFVLDENPVTAAKYACDKHVVKMILESAQMLCAVQPEGTAPYKRSFYNHPCTKWANEFVTNWQWLLAHGLAMCNEYTARYGKVHTCQKTLLAAKEILPTADPQGRSGKGPTPFVFAGPDEFKYDEGIDIYDKYKMYISSKPWVKDNYLRIPNRKPDWV